MSTIHITWLLSRRKKVQMIFARSPTDGVPDANSRVVLLWVEILLIAKKRRSRRNSSNVRRRERNGVMFERRRIRPDSTRNLPAAN